LAKLLPIIDRMRSLLLTPDQVTERFGDTEVNAFVSRAYEKYEQELAKNNAQDFPALMHNAYRLIKAFPTIGNKYRRVYRYWCVDEFQDTNDAQYQFVKELITPSHSNLFVVADDDQIIYQWNGASHERLMAFTADFQPKILQLPTNFRCPPEVVQIANNLIQHNLARSKDKSPIVAEKQSFGDADGVALLSFVNDDLEAKGIAHHVETHTSPQSERIAILARSKRILEKILVALHLAGIQARIVQRRDDFESAHFKWMTAVLRQSISRSDERNFAKLIGAFNAMFHLELSDSDLVAQAKSSHGDLLRLWCAAVDVPIFPIDARTAASNVKKLLVDASNYNEFSTWAVNWLKGIQSTEDQDAFSKFEEDRRAWIGLRSDITQAVGRQAGLEEFLRELDMRSKEPPTGMGEISLMTIHAAKGNEFERVYLAGMAEDILPSFQSKKAGPQSIEMEEERRNCFVAITRASKALTLTYANQYGNWSRQPSRFLREMGLI